MPADPAAAGSVVLPRSKRDGYRWVKGRNVEIRAFPSGAVERAVPDICTGCFGHHHAPETCAMPDWHEIPTGLVD